MWRVTLYGRRRVLVLGALGMGGASAGAGASVSRKQEDLYRRTHLRAPSGNRARNLHLRAIARQRTREQLARADRIELNKVTDHAPQGRQGDV